MRLGLLLIVYISLVSAQNDCSDIRLRITEAIFSKKPSLRKNHSIQRCYEHCIQHTGRNFRALSACIEQQTGYFYEIEELVRYENNIFP